MDRGNISSLTSVRFFAAAWVVLYHTLGGWTLLRDSSPFFGFGYSGVTLFFVLSGFILSYTYSLRKYTLRDFWFARAARILPVYFVALLVALPFAIRNVRVGGAALAPYTLAAPVLLQSWFPKAALLWNGPGWSLSCEALFYLVFPFVAVPVARLSRRYFWPFLAVIWILSAAPAVCYALIRPEGVVDVATEATLLSLVKFNPVIRLPEFLLGIGLGVAFLDGRRMPKARWVAVASVAALVMLLCLPHNLPYPAYHNGLLAPIYAALIFALASAPEMLDFPVLVLLGEASYSLYLLHEPVLNLLALFAKRMRWEQGGGFYLVFLLLCVAISILSYKFVEVPARSWLKGRRERAISPR
jgi:peptidoglycan/LPS O-acetylase OafA/YrhL